MNEYSIENNQKCRVFVRITNTLMPKDDSIELNLYRLIGAIFEEFSEYKNENDKNKKEEEKRDCQYYLISLYNYIFEILDNDIDASGEITISEFLGIMKKRVRRNQTIILDNEMKEHLSALVHYLYDILFNFESPVPFEYTNDSLLVDKRFISELTKKFMLRFPQHCKDWEILPELHLRVLSNLSKEHEKLFYKQINKGLEKYDTFLAPFNKRDCLQDLKEELMDMLMYYSQAILENQGIEAFYIVEEFYEVAVKMKKYIGRK